MIIIWQTGQNGDEVFFLAVASHQGAGKNQENYINTS